MPACGAGDTSSSLVKLPILTNFHMDTVNKLTDRTVIVLPKGRLYGQLMEMFKKIGIALPDVDKIRQYYWKGYFADGIDLFIAKPKAIPQLLDSGLCQYGFCGRDIMLESLVLTNNGNDTIKEMCDTNLNKISIVLAAKKGEGFIPKNRPIICASEFPNIAGMHFMKSGLSHYILDTGGSTEGYPYIGADCIVDVCETGTTIESNGLEIKEVVTESSTVFYGRSDARPLDIVGKIKELFS